MGGCRGKDRRFRMQVLIDSSRYKQTAACESVAKMPAGRHLGPRTVPVKPITENQAAGAANGQILNKVGKLKHLRSMASRITSGQPDIAPDELSRGGQIDGDALEVSATLK